MEGAESNWENFVPIIAMNKHGGFLFFLLTGGIVTHDYRGDQLETIAVLLETQCLLVIEQNPTRMSCLTTFPPPTPQTRKTL